MKCRRIISFIFCLFFSCTVKFEVYAPILDSDVGDIISEDPDISEETDAEQPPLTISVNSCEFSKWTLSLPDLSSANLNSDPFDYSMDSLIKNGKIYTAVAYTYNQSDVSSEKYLLLLEYNAETLELISSNPSSNSPIEYNPELSSDFTVKDSLNVAVFEAGSKVFAAIVIDGVLDTGSVYYYAILVGIVSFPQTTHNVLSVKPVNNSISGSPPGIIKIAPLFDHEDEEYFLEKGFFIVKGNDPDEFILSVNIGKKQLGMSQFESRAYRMLQRDAYNFEISSQIVYSDKNNSEVSVKGYRLRGKNTAVAKGIGFFLDVNDQRRAGVLQTLTSGILEPEFGDKFSFKATPSQNVSASSCLELIDVPGANLFDYIYLADDDNYITFSPDGDPLINDQPSPLKVCFIRGEFPPQIPTPTGDFSCSNYALIDVTGEKLIISSSRALALLLGARSSGIWKYNGKTIYAGTVAKMERMNDNQSGSPVTLFVSYPSDSAEEVVFDNFKACYLNYGLEMGYEPASLSIILFNGKLISQILTVEYGREPKIWLYAYTLGAEWI